MAKYKYSVATDKEHVITLDSDLIYATWRQGEAHAGQKAKFEIGTSFVGQGAKIKVKGKSEGGKNLGKISSTIRNNKFIGEFEIPEDIEPGDMIYFEASLPDNDLEGESNRIPAYPPITVSNMKWSAIEARRGDILTLSADIHGLDDGNEVTVIIYDYHPDYGRDKVSALTGVVKDDKVEVKWEYEYHEDTGQIPSEKELQEHDKEKHYTHPEYHFTVKIANTEYGEEKESGILKFKDWFDFRLLDEDGNPVANEKYILYLSDGTEREGSLDGEGRGHEEGLPPGKVSARFETIGYVTISNE